MKKKTKKGLAQKKESSSLVKRYSILAAILIILVMSGIVLLQYFRPYTVAMVGLTTKEINAYKALFPEDTHFDELPNLFIKETSRKKLKADCVITRHGKPVKTLIDSFEPLSMNTISVIPPSLQSTVRINDNFYSDLPLQLNHFELAWNIDKFTKLALPIPEDRVAMEKAMKKFKDPVGPALLFAGRDDETLLSVLSVLCVSELGNKGYNALVEAIARSNEFSATLDIPLGTDSSNKPVSLRTLSLSIATWQNAGYLHPEWYNLRDTDVRTYMEKGFGFIVLESLSFHRSVEYQTIFSYSSMPFPAASAKNSNTIVAPITAAFFISRKSQTATKAKVIASMVSPENAYNLAKATGFATTISAARAPDLQAADLLAWVAGKEYVVNGLYRDAFADAETAKRFAEEMRDFIRESK